MKKIIVVAIRYSILFGKNTKGFHLSAEQHNHENYKNELFSIERMSLREWLFENFTIKSLKEVFENKSYDVQFKVVVMTSTELPPKNKEFLERMVEENSEWLCLSFVEPTRVKYGEYIYPHLKDYSDEEDLIFATVRLDDDDALFKNYAKELGSLMSRKTDKSVVSFSLGFNLYVTGAKEVIGASEYYHSKNSAGLAYIRAYKNVKDVELDNIYTCGNHIKIDGKFDVIDYDREYSFVRVNTENSDRMYKLDPKRREERVYLEYKRQDKKVLLKDVESKFFSLKKSL